MTEYSILELAKLAHISVRALRHYDEVDLLKPLYRKGNGCRYYGTEEMLRLQEILYFKELGFTLRKIKTLLQTKNITKASILSMQKEALLREIERLQKLTISIEKTIDHYRGCKMTNKEIADQFKDFEKKLHFFEKKVDMRFGEGRVEQAKQLAKTINQDELKIVQEQSIHFTSKLVNAIKDGLTANSLEVQKFLQEHYELSTKFQPMTKEEYLLSREIIKDTPDWYAILHPELPAFLYSAMGIYAKNQL